MTGDIIICMGADSVKRAPRGSVATLRQWATVGDSGRRSGSQRALHTRRRVMVQLGRKEQEWPLSRPIYTDP